MSLGLTFSKLERARWCPESFALPQCSEVDDNEGASRGTAIHAFFRDIVDEFTKLQMIDDDLAKEAASKKGPPHKRRTVEEMLTEARDRALSAVTEEHASAAQAMEIAFLLEIGLGQRGIVFRPEVGYALHVESGEVVDLGPGWEHDAFVVKLKAIEKEKGGTWIGGIVDLEMLHRETNRGALIDYKTGRGHVTAAKNNPQVRACALCFATAHKVDDVRVGIARTFTDATFFNHDDLSSFDLALVLGEIQDIVVSVEAAMHPRMLLQTAGGNPTFSRQYPPHYRGGKHCRYCPGFYSCPIKIGLIRNLVEKPTEVVEGVVSLLRKPETRVEAYRRLQEIGKVYSEMWVQMDGCARNTPIDLGGGALYGPYYNPKTTIAGDPAYKVLTKLFGEPVADAAVQMKTSKSAIDEALRPVAEKDKKPRAQLLRLVLSALEKIPGAMGKTSKPPEQWECSEYQTKKPEPKSKSKSKPAA